MILYNANGIPNQPCIEYRTRNISWVVMEDYEPKLERLAGKIRETARKISSFLYVFV